MKFLIIHGPNLSVLGRRKPDIYGTATLAQINAAIKTKAAELKCRVRVFQSNSEGGIIDIIEKNSGWADAIIINPGAYTHYSYAIRDAIEAAGLPAAEVHMSDISKREPFRRKSVIKPVCEAQFKGLGLNSYIKAMLYFAGK